MLEQNNYLTAREEDYLVRGAGLRSVKSGYSNMNPSYESGRKEYIQASNFAMQGFRGEY